MALFWQNIANGLTVGSLYALVAIGYTMVYGILRLINFAHGDIFMLAMYFSFFAISIFYIPWYFAIILVLAATAVLGIVIEKTAYAPIRSAPRISLLISSIGISYFLENFATVVFTGIPRQFPPISILQNNLVIFGISIQMLSFVTPVIMVVLVVVLLFLIERTKSGMAMRALSKDFETAKLMGININRTISITFAMGSLLAAVGAIMWGQKYPQIQPYIGVMPGLKCFIAAVIGGIGNIRGAVVGGLMLGMLEIMIVFAVPTLSGYKDAIAFIALIAILLFMPTGLFGEKVTDKV